MTDERRGDPLAAVLRLGSGCGVVIRHREQGARRALAEKLVPVCRQRRVTCLIAGDWRLAAALRADGIHLPERLARIGSSCGAVLWRRKMGRMLTVAAHSAAALRSARACRADAAFLAPVFATVSHPDRAPLGLARARAMAMGAGIPVMALGGVSAANARALTAFAGIAGIGWAEN